MRVAECFSSGDSSLLSSMAAAAAGPDKGASLAALQLLHGTCAAYPPLCCVAAVAGLPQASHPPKFLKVLGTLEYCLFFRSTGQRPLMHALAAFECLLSRMCCTTKSLICAYGQRRASSFLLC